jgi:hypothetical protein
VEPGEEMMIWRVGGRSMLKRQTFPPPLEVAEGGGVYVLEDDGEPSDWRDVNVDRHGPSVIAEV